MSWKSLTRSKKSIPDMRSDTPTPANPNGGSGNDSPYRTGLLAIRVLWAEDVNLPDGKAVPPAVESALSSQAAKVASAVDPLSVSQQQQRLAKTKGHGYKDSVQRTQCWWLPYLVMEYEVNQVLITALGGDLEKPVFMYQANLCVYNALAHVC